MKSLVHFALGCVAMTFVLSPAFATTPPREVVVHVSSAYPDELIREVVVREVVRERCDGDVALKQINEVLRSRAESGEAGVGNDASQPESGALAQQATARSGLANIGQITDIIAACSTVNANLTNTVTDSEARSGDAEARNVVAPYATSTVTALNP